MTYNVFSGTLNPTHFTFGNYRVDKQADWQTNRRRWRHPPRSTMLCRWVTTTAAVIQL